MIWKRTLLASGIIATLTLGILEGLKSLDHAWPPPLPAPSSRSVEVVDRDGQLLRAFATREGRWRLAVDLDDVDPDFVRMVLAYEDKRFYHHGGVDFLAMLRAGWQMLRHGRIVSGGSTITMQLARLLEPRTERSLQAKIAQMIRAVQIERRLGKREILELYLTHAPYGGNLEGIRAASLAWFGKEPKALNLAEAGLLVALPQSPESRRPDRNPQRARTARNTIIQRLVETGVIEKAEARQVSSQAIPATRKAMPTLAAHLADEARRQQPSTRHHSTTLSRDKQQALEQLAQEAARRLGSRITVAIVLADARTGEILANVGSSDLLDQRRSGWIDMTKVTRSPGSTLKPFIYALALEDGLVMPQTLISDRPENFDGYRPGNFDMTYQGDVTVREALQLSLNIPAIRLLSATGPGRLLGRLHRARAVLDLPDDTAPGLAIGLGGIGITLTDLVQAYTVFPNRGRAAILGDGITSEPSPPRRKTFTAVAAWHVTDMLKGVAPPADNARLPVAYKTGTSYGYRDAWSVGFDGRHVLGIWVGRADGAPLPGLSGISAAAPILFDGFLRAGLSFEALPSAPPGAVRIENHDLPASVRRFTAPDSSLPSVDVTGSPFSITYPPDGARVDLGLASGTLAQPLMLKVQGGRAPFRLLANGAPVEGLLRTRSAQWAASGTGFSKLSIIDSTGKSASVTVFLE